MCRSARSDEELEQVWSGKTIKEALDSIVKRGDEQLERFRKRTSLEP
jgi:sn-glycerol 3-phosphate transport system substrate-binding protein